MERYSYPEIMVLGSTGSVGTQAIDVAEKENISVRAISADKNFKLVEEQARELGVMACAMNDIDAANELKVRLADTNIKVYGGKDGICEMIHDVNSNSGNKITAINSIVGGAGLKPTLAIIESGKVLALANKESLVVGGDTVMRMCKERNTEILPIDSEHSAIFQCLRAGENKEIKKILLTASGGPFFGYSKEQLANITVRDALAHPTWKMGAKITIDSATLMNKGFEIIEAVHLFGVSPDNIEVVVHRESIVHSAIEYIDNSIIAQMSKPDMRHCVQYALTHPKRTSAVTEELDLFSVGKLTFMRPDIETFPLLSLAKTAINMGGAVPAVLNYANEVAVDAFLKEKISFTDIFEVVEDTVDNYKDRKDVYDIDEIFEICDECIAYAKEQINSKAVF